ncbi:MAG: type I-E CRISPR-associated protein Cse1/CasA [Chloroflexota bacterium]
MRPSFNLVDKPWIPCLQADGTAVELGLRDVLLQAHELRGLHGESPLVVAALYRVVLALLHRVVDGPRDSRDWAALWRRGVWDPKRVEAYLERWHERFDLFHPERPFYQWATDTSREKTVMDLLPEMASGNNATLFDHHTEDAHVAFTPAQAARALLFVQSCSFAGGMGLAPRESSDGPWARGVVFLLEGDTLFETLALNLVPYRDMAERGIPKTEADRPVWEADNPLDPDRQVPLGYLDFLTWPTRSIWLHGEVENGGPMVRRLRMAPGMRLVDGLRDPFNHFTRDEQRGYRPYRFSEARVLWRDSASFLRLKALKEVDPPETLKYLAELVEDEVVETHRLYRYMALGMANNQAKVEFYRWEHLPLPGIYLKKPDLVDALRTALESAETTRSRLGAALARSASLLLSPTADDPNGRKPDRKDVNDLLAHWAFDRAYWGALEIPFLDLLSRLPDAGEEALNRWSLNLQRVARQVFEQVESALGTNARALRAGVRGRGQLEGSLKKLFEPEAWTA